MLSSGVGSFQLEPSAGTASRSQPPSLSLPFLQSNKWFSLDQVFGTGSFGGWASPRGRGRWKEGRGQGLLRNGWAAPAGLQSPCHPLFAIRWHVLRRTRPSSWANRRRIEFLPLRAFHFLNPLVPRNLERLPPRPIFPFIAVH